MRFPSISLIPVLVGIAVLAGCAAPASSPQPSNEPAAKERRLEPRPTTAGNPRKEEGAW